MADASQPPGWLGELARIGQQLDILSQTRTQFGLMIARPGSFLHDPSMSDVARAAIASTIVGEGPFGNKDSRAKPIHYWLMAQKFTPLTGASNAPHVNLDVARRDLQDVLRLIQLAYAVHWNNTTASFPLAFPHGRAKFLLAMRAICLKMPGDVLLGVIEPADGPFAVRRVAVARHARDESRSRLA